MALRNIAGLSQVLRKGKVPLYTGQNGMDEQKVVTLSSEDQQEVEQSVEECVETMNAISRETPGEHFMPKLNRYKHTRFLLKAVKSLPSGYQVLDASGPWLCYWIVHSLNLLGVKIDDQTKSSFVYYLKRCEHPSGGYGGGQLQFPHLAPSYGAVNCLISLGTKEAYDSIDRESLYDFLTRMHQEDGSFIMHDGGEVDIRGTYCALAVARLTNMLTPHLTNKCVDFVLKCQTFEGGFGGLPGLEAHGGYSFCGIAALAILGAEEKCDLESLLSWLTFRQCPFEGGFNGRTNKLVDGCYSFWQGGAFPIVYRALSLINERYIDALPLENWIFNQSALQEYILACCQHHPGGLVDKPGKLPDFYHTCYVLSGLSISQHFTLSADSPLTLIGGAENLLNLTNPLHNVLKECAAKAFVYFDQLPQPL